MVDALRYAVILEPDPRVGGFNVRIPAFPHAHTQGEDVQHALRKAREVIELEIVVMLERGDALPQPDGDAEIRVERIAVTPPARDLPRSYAGVLGDVFNGTTNENVAYVRAERATWG